MCFFAVFIPLFYNLRLAKTPFWASHCPQNLQIWDFFCTFAPLLLLAACPMNHTAKQIVRLMGD